MALANAVDSTVEPADTAEPDADCSNNTLSNDYPEDDSQRIPLAIQMMTEWKQAGALPTDLTARAQQVADPTARSRRDQMIADVWGPSAAQRTTELENGLALVANDPTYDAYDSAQFNGTLICIESDHNESVMEFNGATTWTGGAGTTTDSTCQWNIEMSRVNLLSPWYFNFAHPAPGTDCGG